MLGSDRQPALAHSKVSTAICGVMTGGPHGRISSMQPKPSINAKVVVTPVTLIKQNQVETKSSTTSSRSKTLTLSNPKVSCQNKPGLCGEAVEGFFLMNGPRPSPGSSLQLRRIVWKYRVKLNDSGGTLMYAHSTNSQCLQATTVPESCNSTAGRSVTGRWRGCRGGGLAGQQGPFQARRN